MNAYNLSVLFFAYSAFLLSLLLLVKNNDPLNRSFFIFNIFVCMWGFNISWMLNSSISYEEAMLASRLANLGALFIPPSWLGFVCAFLEIKEEKSRIIKLIYILSACVALFSFSPLYVSSVKSFSDFKYYTVAGPVYHLFTIEFTLVVMYGFYHLFKALKGKTGVKRTQHIVFTCAIGFGFVGGSLTFLPVYNIPLPQYGLFLLPLYPFLMTFAIMRHGFLDQDDILAIHKDKLALLGLISSSLNHEIKNPLFLLKGYVQKMELSTKDPSLPKMSEQISRMSNLVERLGEFAKPGSGAKEEVYLEKAIDNALFFAMQELKYQNIEVKTDIQKPLPNPIGNRGQFEEIFLNLIVNAFHAMSPGGGKLTISAISEIRNSKSEIIITISDSGCGIPKDRLKRVFEPFYTTKTGRGTGLGLHIVKTLVEQNDGKISVESEVGKGTKFKLEFSTK